jgi:hypothetical protein
MRWPSVLGTVALTEIMAHFLSLGWGIMTLLAAFAWVALSGASVAAKARGTEDRVNALVPVIGAASTLAANAFPKTGGTVSGSVTVNGAHTVNGQVNASTLSVAGNATTAGTHTVHGSMNADGNVTAGSAISASGQVSGSNFSGGSIHVSGSGQADGNFTAGGQVSGSSFSGNSIHVSGNAQADGTLTVSGQRIAPGQGTPAGYPASGSPSTAGLGSYSNAIVNGLIAAGIF